MGSKRRKSAYWIALSAVVGLCALNVPRIAAAQGAPGPQAPAPDQSAPKQTDSAKPSAPAEDQTPAYNPVPAEKDVEVATYYMRKGDSDAAIPRLEDAIRVKPDFAKPRIMLAEIYEKKGEKDNAVKYYQDYLKVFPHAPDAKKIQAKIDKLSK